MASQLIHFLPLGPESALGALEWFPLVATRSQPVKRRVIRLFPLRDQGVAGSNPVFPTNLTKGRICREHDREVAGCSTTEGDAEHFTYAPVRLYNRPCVARYLPAPRYGSLKLPLAERPPRAHFPLLFFVARAGTSDAPLPAV